MLTCFFFSFLFSSLLHLPLLTAHELGHIFGCYQGKHGLSLTPKEYCVAITKPDRMRWKSKRPCWSLLNRQITRALLSFTYLLMGTTCCDAVCVCFLETLLTFKQEKTIPVPAGRWLTWEPLYKNVPLITVHSCSGACWKIPSPPRALGPLSLGNVSPPPARTLNLVYKCPSLPPVHLLPPPPTPALALAHTLWYALKFNQMLNYILTWVPTSWLYSPVSD